MLKKYDKVYTSPVILRKEWLTMKKVIKWLSKIQDYTRYEKNMQNEW